MTLAPNSVNETLSSNTGLKSQPGFTVALDWLDLTFKNLHGAAHAFQLVRDFERLTGDSIEFSPTLATFNGHRWEGSGRGVKGTLVWYQGRQVGEDGHPVPARLKIAMSGRVLAGADMEAIAMYCREVASHLQPECTRIDIALDDHRKFIALWQITEARKAGNFFNASYTAEMVSCERGKTEGRTIYFGAPSSDKRLRIYDKTIESGGVVDANRWEAQFRRKAAQVVFKHWLETSKNGPQGSDRMLQNYVLGLIDFRERDDDDPNRKRKKPLIWYTELCELLSSCPAVVRIAAVVQSAQSSIDWVAKSVAPSLAMLRAVLGDGYEKYINSVVDEGVAKMSRIRRRLIETTDKEQLCY